MPRYASYFPEYWLNAIQTETLVRDSRPQTTGSRAWRMAEDGARRRRPRRTCG